MIPLPHPDPEAARWELADARERAHALGNRLGPTFSLAQVLLARCRREGVPVADLAPMLRAAGMEEP